MKEIFKIGDEKYFETKVESKDTAGFSSGNVHPVYATFALGRDAEWCCRLFVLEMKEEHEEGIGTFLTIEHISPALIGSTVNFMATVIELSGNGIVCEWKALAGERLIAKGTQGQKILPKLKLEQIFDRLKQEE